VDILAVLRKAGGVRTRAAKLLGITYSTLNYHLRRLCTPEQIAEVVAARPRKGPQGEAIRRLWCQRLEQPQDPDVRRRLIEYYMPAADRIVARVLHDVPVSVDTESLSQAAYLGLIQAVDSFDVHRGVRFINYAFHRIRGAALDYLRQQDMQAKSVRARIRLRQRTAIRLANELGYWPTDDEVAEELGWTTEEISETTDCWRESLESLDQSNNPPKLYDKGLSSVRRLQWFDRLTRGLTSQEKTVLYLRFYVRRTFEEIGRAMGISQSRTYKLLKGSLQHLSGRHNRAEMYDDLKWCNKGES
jgi:RNA polymerase sigma factor for flagellar operon FliA